MLDQDLVLTILKLLRQVEATYQGKTIYYSQFPEGHSDLKIDWHFDYCQKQGFLTHSSSGDKIMTTAQLTQEGLDYLTDNE